MERRAWWMLGLVLLLGGCGYGDVEKTAMALTGGDPKQGPALIHKYGCGACHNIPGVDGARGMVGPPLDTIASRSYLAGQLPNTPENLMLWIRKPQDVEAGTAMPDMGVTEKDGRDIAAYLYTLR
ncbi:MAG TPA: c-type cytochrome [Thermoanaerobaculia bacterium]|nr:c-type cytochrome [Thermoanaerobaculia bacterium]